MIQRLNYGDHIFFLAVRVRSLRDSGRLELGSAVFVDRIREDIIFVDTAIRTLSQSLKDGSLMKNRIVYLRDITRLMYEFSSMLTRIIAGETSISESLKPQFKSYQSLSDRLKGEIEEIETIINGIVGTNRDGDFIISEEEYKSLLSDGDDKA